MSMSPENDLNYQAYLEANERGDFIDLKPGTYVAFFNGLLLGNAPDFDSLQLVIGEQPGMVFVHQVNLSEQRLRVHRGPRIVQENIEKDANILAYRELESDPEWFNNFKGKYVAVVNGTMVTSNEDRDTLLSELREQYPNTAAFFVLVGDETVIDVPTPLLIEEADQDTSNL